MAISDAMRFRMYNSALRLLKQSKLSSITEDIEARHLLDDAWDDGALDYCLEAGQWQFAARTISLTYSPSVQPSFGLRYAFQKPEDLIRLICMCQDEFLEVPLTRYREDGGLWLADLDTIYVRYVSKDNAFGYDESLWTERFTQFVEAKLAMDIVRNLTVSDGVKDDVEEEYDKRKMMANSLDAQGQPTRFMPPGRWTSSRLGNNRRYDRGSR